MKKLLSLALIAVAVVVVVAGCNKADTGSSSATPSTNAPAAK